MTTASEKHALKSRSVIRRGERILVYGFALKCPAPEPNEERGEKAAVGQGCRPVLPRNQRPIMDDQVAHIEQLQVRNQIVDRVSDRPARLGELKRDFVQMAANHEDA